MLPDELAAMAKLLEEHEIPEAKIWLSAGLSAFLFLYTSILGGKPGKVVVCSTAMVLSSIILEKVTAELASHGFRCFKVEVGGQGVQVSHG
ncbi:hypothetical protein EJB05_50988 [Eragrostis curvula]|uniref:Uncharacterized protein n=1 Tax=Eragrostis curvula TaxID=38414 RepID=A0A5J9SWZ4_9POAL|nr:hypothetical protein EJB05_50988 [Eragrostis curvula]